ncbi:putative G-protein coupled receptor 156 [Lithobates pipiens]
MEPPLNCSALSESHIETTLDRMEALGVLEELCRMSGASDRTQLSSAVQGILGSLLSCGLLLSLFFIIFTIRFRQNRIVKMSSPNLNLVILLGSLLVYISAFLFALQESISSIQTVIQVRISFLYIGVSLVFGPLLGKSWRLHRVFTHRIPDKRVIIKDLTLLGLQAALLFIDSVLLLSWVLSDPVLCAQNVSASIKAVERETRCAVTRTLSCSSLYPDFWLALLLGFKGIFLVYGSYLAGLTKNISTPPVNQSLVIMVGSTLVIVGTGLVLLVTRFFHSWPNLVYGVTSGSILICTTTINCLIFIPQLLQWRQLNEEPSHTNVHMAKYFNSPSKSMRSMYSEEQIYHLLGENTSMRRLLTEKNAAIDSLQEQVTNAKEKLMQLLKSECNVEITDVSMLSTSTLTIQQQEAPVGEAANEPESQEPSDNVRNNDTNLDQSLHEEGALESNDENPQPLTEEPQESQGNDLQPTKCSSPKPEIGMPTCPVESTSKPQSECTDKGAEGTCEAWERLSRKMNYVSTEKLQEILRELSVETLSKGCQMSPGRQRRASYSVHREPTGHSTDVFRNVSLNFSPSMPRRRRGLAYSRRNAGPSSQAYKERSQADQWFSNQGARDRCEGASIHMEDTLNDPGETRLEETVDDLSQHLPSSPANIMELGVHMEGTRVHENGGLWISTLSDPTNFPRQPSHLVNWIHAGQDTYGPLRFRSESPFSESDSSSSEETFCLCHRPYCDICFPHMCETSDTETESTDYLKCWPTHLTGSQLVVNFKEDLQPTLV